MATRLKYNVGITINLGNCQSARVDIGLEKDVEGVAGSHGLQCQIMSGYMKDFQGWCDKELAAKVKQIKEDNNVK